MFMYVSHTADDHTCVDNCQEKSQKCNGEVDDIVLCELPLVSFDLDPNIIQCESFIFKHCVFGLIIIV